MTPTELSRLISARLDETITPEDFTLLENELRRSPDARGVWLRAIHLESALRDWAGDERSLNAAWQPAAASRPRPWLVPLAAAAAIAVLTTLAWNFRPAPTRPTVAAAPGVEKTAQGCAVITQSAGAQWQSAAGDMRLGDILNTGPLILQQGLAQIEFFSGAKLVVEGPAEFQIVSSWEVTWQHGKARVHVPPAARGFRILTPGMKLVDLGTEFGVEVNSATRDTRVAVFAGEVVAHPGSGQPQLSLREGEGLAQTGARIDRIAAGRPDDFVNGNNLQQLSQQHAQTRFSAWVNASRIQASDTRLIAYYPLLELDPWSRIVRNAASAANRDLDGGAVGALRTNGRWPQKPALEFKRPGDRVRLQIDGTYEAVAMACWVKVDGLDRTFNALFLTDGYEIGEPHWQIYEDGRLMFSISYPDDTGKRHNQIYYSPVVFDTANLGRWHHIAVSYDNRSGEVAQFIDGRELSREVNPRHASGRPIVIGPSELGNWGLPTQNHRFPIRNFNGSIDEFALYRTTLTPAEIRALYDAGRPE